MKNHNKINDFGENPIQTHENPTNPNKNQKQSKQTLDDQQNQMFLSVFDPAVVHVRPVYKASAKGLKTFDLFDCLRFFFCVLCFV